MKLFKFLPIVLLANAGFSQAVTGKVVSDHNGFQTIELPAEIRSASKEDLGDLRIYDASQHEVPYLVNDNVEKAARPFEWYPIVSRTVIPNKSTSITFGVGREIKLISLYIANTEVVKKFRISGSNDQKSWFGVVDNRALSDLKNENSDHIVVVIPLPRVSYKFLKIDFDDTKTLPVNVLKIGNAAPANQVAPHLLEIAAAKIQISQIKPDKKTKIRVSFPFGRHIDKITFDVATPEHYFRTVRVYAIESRKIKRRTESFENDLAAFQVTSGDINGYNINIQDLKEFYIDIQNSDNPPLEISKIRFWQVPVSIIANLKNNESYTLKSGQPKLNTPDYELGYFRDQIASNLPKAAVSQVTHEKFPEIKTVTSNAFWQQSWFLWMCIGIGGMALLYFTLRLVKDIK